MSTKKMAPIAITGLGVYTSLGCGIDENWQHLQQGHSGVRLITDFSTEHLRTKIAAQVNYPGDLMAKQRGIMASVIQQALIQSQLSAAQVKLAHAVIAAPPAIDILWPQRLRLAARNDNTQGDLSYMPYAQQADFIGFLQAKWDFAQVPYIVNTACASGASAIQLAAEQILLGKTKLAMAAGVDTTVLPENIVRFSLLSTLSTANEDPAQASKPFSRNRDGFVLGEGAAALILEDVEHAKARGAPILAYLLGAADVTDNFHRTRSNPSAEKIVACMQKALQQAGVAPNEIDYINAHGTSTPENDKMESKGIQLLFGDHCQQLLVSSNKSMIGHTLSAAGAIEAVFSVLTLQHQIVPPTINYSEPDPEILLNVVPNQACAAKMSKILSNSFGFGGQNVSLVFGDCP